MDAALRSHVDARRQVAEGRRLRRGDGLGRTRTHSAGSNGRHSALVYRPPLHTRYGGGGGCGGGWRVLMRLCGDVNCCGRVDLGWRRIVAGRHSGVGDSCSVPGLRCGESNVIGRGRHRPAGSEGGSGDASCGVGFPKIPAARTQRHAVEMCVASCPPGCVVRSPRPRASALLRSMYDQCLFLDFFFLFRRRARPRSFQGRIRRMKQSEITSFGIIYFRDTPLGDRFRARIVS
jgi:hypothetical protein